LSGRTESQWDRLNCRDSVANKRELPQWKPATSVSVDGRPSCFFRQKVSADLRHTLHSPPTSHSAPPSKNDDLQPTWQRICIVPLADDDVDPAWTADRLVGFRPSCLDQREALARDNPTPQTRSRNGGHLFRTLARYSRHPTDFHDAQLHNIRRRARPNRRRPSECHPLELFLESHPVSCPFLLRVWKCNEFQYNYRKPTQRGTAYVAGRWLCR